MPSDRSLIAVSLRSALDSLAVLRRRLRLSPGNVTPRRRCSGLRQAPVKLPSCSAPLRQSSSSSPGTGSILLQCLVFPRDTVALFSIS